MSVVAVVWFSSPRRASCYTPSIPGGSTVTTSPHHPASVIAIDGPAASGKSAVGVAVAAKLGFRFFDTGAMYRAVTWLALQRGIDAHDAPALARLAADADITVGEAGASAIEPTAVQLDGEDATPHLRESAVEANVSLVSRVPEVRTALVGVQRRLAARGRVVMAGRDIGSVVLPDAELKIYLDASREVRARRRALQLREAGQDPDLGALVEDLARRDGLDASRETSPLTAAPGAVIIHTDDLSVTEVVRRILSLAA
ncbi:MAG TPA: (d)CMP kinase [Dehalococcoidia bacterium]|nr:(d)CMP kinase [Dehalococcoidia bacterium]